MKRRQKLTSVVVGAVLMLSGIGSLFATPVAAAEPAETKYIYFTVERDTLGADPYILPTKVAMETKDGKDDIFGTIQKNFPDMAFNPGSIYLPAIKNADPGVDNINVPAKITELAAKYGEEVTTETARDFDNDSAPDLGEFSYSAYSGWNDFINNDTSKYIGMSDDQTFADGDVIEYRFTLYGWGEDLTGTHYNSDGTTSNAGVVSNPSKVDLIKAIADTRAAHTDEEISSDTDLKEAYDKAVAAFSTYEPEASEIQSATTNLTKKEAAYVKAQQKKAEEERKQQEQIERSKNLDLEKIVADGISTESGMFDENSKYTGSDWVIMNLAKAGAVTEAQKNGYVQMVTDKLTAGDGKMSKRQSTDQAKAVLGLTSLGVDVTDVAGYNMLDAMADLTYVNRVKPTGAIFTLLAFDSNHYEIPTLPEGSTGTQTTRENLIESILATEKADGGFAFSGAVADPDMTAMALQALAPYKDRENVKPVIERALNVLKGQQLADGGFKSWGTENSNSLAEVVLALSALGKDALEDPDFVKNGVTPAAALGAYALENGGWAYTPGSTANNAMAAYSAVRALLSYQRVMNGESSFYDFYVAPEPQPEPQAEEKPQIAEIAPVTGEASESALSTETEIAPETGDAWSREGILMILILCFSAMTVAAAVKKKDVQ